MFSLSARFRKSRIPDADGTVYYVIRQGHAKRNITGNLRGKNESILSERKDRIASDLMTIYCVIDSLLKRNGKVTLDEIVNDGTKALRETNPFSERLISYTGKYTISDEIAKVSRMFSDKFERVRPCEHDDRSSIKGLISYISALTAEYKRCGKPYARSLRSTQLKLMTYLNNADIPIVSITPSFILDYKVYLSKGVSADTVSFYLRVLHTVLNRAQKEGLLPMDFIWPSNIRTTDLRNSQRPENSALDMATIRRIEQLDLSDDKSLELARDIFIFGFYAQGMELIDVANLKAENLKGNILTYSRRHKGKVRRVVLGEKALAIIRKYHDGSLAHLFPLIERRWKYSYTTIRSETALSLKEIGQKLGLPVVLTYSMNIYSWQAIIRNTNIAELLIC